MSATREGQQNDTWHEAQRKVSGATGTVKNTFTVKLTRQSKSLCQPNVSRAKKFSAPFMMMLLLHACCVMIIQDFFAKEQPATWFDMLCTSDLIPFDFQN